MMIRYLLPVAACALLVDEGRSQEAPAPAAPAAAERPATASRARRNRDLLTRVEIAERTETDLFTLIYTIRPSWLRSRGQAYLDGTEEIQVYVNNQPVGNPNFLRQINPHQVESVQHLDAVRASSRLGGGHGLGAILVTLR